MALTQEDLQAIGALLDNRLDGALTPIKEDLKRLNETVAKIENVHGYKLGALFDGQIDYQRKAEEIQNIADTVEEHENRLFALEQTIKAANG